MVALFLLYFFKNSWQFIVLYLYFIYELVPYFVCMYFIYYTLTVIISAILFIVFFCYFYFYFFFSFIFCVYIGVLFIFIDIGDLIKNVFLFIINYPFNSFNLFFCLLVGLLLLKFTLYVFLVITKKGFYILSFNLLQKRQKILKNFWSILYEEYKVPILSESWRSLTTFLRIKHYKATILCLYVIYIPVVLKLIFMDFNPVC